MRKIRLPALVAVCYLFALAGTALAADNAPLGQSQFALKAGYINFTDSAAEDLDIDEGWYVGTEAFFLVADNLYLGGEIGFAQNEGEIDLLTTDVDTELTYIPVELNVKYAFALTPQAILSVGAGGSYNYADFEAAAFGTSESDDEWLWGGQVFGDFTFNANAFLLGVQAKYQSVEENTDNWRITGNLGYRF